jgi:GNAT superfamily N-acetyltransferase
MGVVGLVEVNSKDRRDLSRYVELCREYFAESFPETLDSEWDKTYARSLRRRQADEGRRYIVCTLDGQPAGLANLYRQGKIGMIAEFYIRPEHRRKGMGRRFFDLCRGILAEMGARTIEIGVQMNWPGRVEFWKAMGFSTYRLLMRRPTE